MRTASVALSCMGAAACVVVETDTSRDAGDETGGSGAGTSEGGAAGFGGSLGGASGSSAAGSSAGGSAGTMAAGSGGLPGTGGSSAGTGGLAGAGGEAGNAGGSGGTSGGEVIDESGGTVVATETGIAGASVEIPAGALAAPTLISITPGSDVTSQDARGPAVKFSPDGTAFAVPANVTVPVTDATGQVILLKRDDQTGTTEYIENVAISAGMLTGPVDSFSTMQAAACQPNGCGGCTPLPNLGQHCGTCGVTVCHGTDPNQTSCDQRLCTFSSVSVGESQTCVTRSDGSGSCFGLGSAPGAGHMPPASLPTQKLVSGTSYTCALGASGAVTCWGSGPSSVPSTSFMDLQVGNQWACGLRSSDRGIECWSGSAVTPPAGASYQSLALAGTAGCAVNASGGIECFGSFSAQIPGGNFDRVRGGAAMFCALAPTGEVQCFGSGLTGGLSQFTSLSTTSYKDVAINQDGICLILADDTLECHARQATPIVPPNGTFRSVSGGGLRFCAVSSDDRVECWGDNTHGAAQPLQRRYGAVAVGDSAGCGLAAGGVLDCWGTTDVGQTPSGLFAEVHAAAGYVCARDGSGQISCFQEGPGTAPAPSGTFIGFDVGSTSASPRFGCGVRSDQTISCWGYPGAVVPSGTFLGLSLGDARLCAIRTDETVGCYSLATGTVHGVPSGQFSQVDTNEGALTCGVRKATGALECWDLSGGPLQIGPGQYLTPPAGAFKRVVCGSASENNACAQAQDDSVHCFGTDASLGQLTPPAGTFSSIDYFRTALCGTRFDGSVTCWGSLLRSP